MKHDTIKGTLEYVGNSSSWSTGNGPVLNLYSVLRIGGKELRRVQIRHEFANFHVGDQVRMLYTSPFWNRFSANGAKHFVIAVESPQGTFKGEAGQMVGEAVVITIVSAIGNALIAIVVWVAISSVIGNSTDVSVAIAAGLWIFLMARLVRRILVMYRAVSSF